MTTSRDELLRELSDKIIAALLSDLTGRKGIGDEWDQIDDDVKKEIASAWQSRINAILRAAPPSAEGWIAVSERLPEEGQKILTWNGKRIEADDHARPDWLGSPSRITYWQPQPAAPKDKP